MMRPVRRLVPIVALVAALCVGLLPAAADAAMPAVIHLPKGTEAEALAVGPEGDLWFAGVRRRGEWADVSGRIAADGSVEEFPVPESAAAPGVGDLTLGPDGNMWFTEPNAGRIDFEAPSGGGPGVLVLPDASSRPTGLATVGSTIWTTLEGAGELLVTYPKTATGRSYGAARGQPSQIALDDHGSLWVIVAGGSGLLRKPVSGSSISLQTPNFAKGAKFTDVVDGPDGNIWLSQSDGPYISRVEPEIPRYTRFELAVQGGFSLISDGPREDLWYAGGGRIGSITDDGRWVGKPTCALPGCPPVAALTEGPEGGLWFASGGTIARFEPAPLSVTFTSGLNAQGSSHATLRLACDGGAAAQRCQGKIEILPSKGPGGRLGSGLFNIRTGEARKLRLNLAQATVEELKRAGKLQVRLVARIAGKVSATRHTVLRAPK